MCSDVLTFTGDVHEGNQVKQLIALNSIKLINSIKSKHGIKASFWSWQLRKQHAESKRDQCGPQNENNRCTQSRAGISQRFQVSRSGVRGIIQIFKDSNTVQNKPGRGRKRTLSVRLERKLVSPKALSKDLATGVIVSKKTIIRALHRNGLRGCRPRKPPLLRKRHLQARLQYARDNREKDYSYWKHVLWSDETKLKLFGHRDSAYVWRK